MKLKSYPVLLLALIAGVLLLGGGYAGIRSYQSARQAKLIQQARAYLAGLDPRKALLVLQRALRYNSKDTDACRLMAELAEASRSPAALLWRRRAVECSPRSIFDRLALARTAIVFRDYPAAALALEGANAAERKIAAYHNIAGTVAAATRQPDLAEAHFLEAERLEPQNPVSQLNVAVSRLQRTNASVLSEARRALQVISANPSNAIVRCQALRERVVDAMRSSQAGTALTLSQQLLRETNSVFQDRILQLNVLRATTNVLYPAALASFQLEAARDPGKIYELGTWQLANTSASETMRWLRSVPMREQTNPPTALLISECYTALPDWRGLQQFVEFQNWAELEFVRRAFAARALREQDMGGAAKSEWELALKAAGGQKECLVTLLEMAANWNWPSEREELLWNFVNRFPGERWAFQALHQTLFVGGRTRPLMMLYNQALKRSPTDLALKNNLAVTALLLEAKELKPHDLALEVYQKAPTNSSYASTYAFSLHLQGKSSEALKIMQGIDPKQLEAPSIAGYYGLLLQAAGDGAKAKPFLTRSLQARLLPEERKLFDRAKSGT